jgi:Tfp pilus assembly protein PilZ
LPLNIEMDYQVRGVGDTDLDTGHGKNLSAGGICVILGRRLQMGTQLALSLHLPNSYSPLHVSGRVVWSEECRVGQDRIFETGLSFKDLSEADQTELQRLLNTCGGPTASP